MKTETVNRWLTLAANLGVLVGIGLLYVELRQNSELMRLQFYEDIRSSFQELELAMLNDKAAETWRKSVFDPASLTLSEIRTMDGYYGSVMLMARRIQVLESEGLLPVGSTEQTFRSTADYFFGNEFSKAWWKYEGSTWNPELVRIVGPIIDGVDKDTNKSKYLNIQREVSSNDPGDDG